MQYKINYNDSILNDILNYNIPIPRYSYPLNNDKISKLIKTYIDKCDGKTALLVQRLIYNTKHITFEKFIESLIISINKFENDIQNNDFIMYVPNGYSTKSNFWISAMVYNLLNKKPIDVVNYLSNDHNDKHILLCDDGIYSGTQMSEILFSIYKFTENNKVNLIIPYITTDGLKYINDRFRVNIYYNVLMNGVKDILSNDEYNLIKQIIVSNKNVSTYYFDHKLPDDYSTLHFLYNDGRVKCNQMDFERYDVGTLLHNCDNYKYNCPPPPYQFTNDERILLLTRDEFIKRYKKIE